MKNNYEKIHVSTEKGIDIVNLTDEVKEKLGNVEIKKGTCTVFNPGSTASIIINEDEPMLRKDLKDKLSELVEENKVYHHPSNGHSHIRSILLGPSETIPIINGELDMGTWQEIMLIEMDIKPRKREVTVVFQGK
ncbi:MAG: secondary thiamine-phosphate synthase enzyme YjbQ [Candidatus Aenigmatarchaeota archaeon]